MRRINLFVLIFSCFSLVLLQSKNAQQSYILNYSRDYNLKVELLRSESGQPGSYACKGRATLIPKSNDPNQVAPSLDTAQINNILTSAVLNNLDCETRQNCSLSVKTVKGTHPDVPSNVATFQLALKKKPAISTPEESYFPPQSPNISGQTSYPVGHGQLRKFMNQGHHELGNTGGIRNRRKIPMDLLLAEKNLNVDLIVGLSRTRPSSMTYELSQCSRGELEFIEGEMRKALHALDDDGFRGKVLAHKKIGHYSKAVQEKDYGFNIVKILWRKIKKKHDSALKNLANHVIACSKIAFKEIERKETAERAKRVAGALAAQQKNDHEYELRFQNYKEILHAHRSEVLGGGDPVKKKLVDFGEKLLAALDYNQACIPRLNYVVKTLRNDGVIREEKYRIGDKVKDCGHEYEIASDDIEVFSGNELQHYFHEQVVKSLDRSFAACPSDIKTISIGSLKCAYAANRANEYSLVSACLDFADSAFYMIKRMGSGIEQCKVDVQRALSFLSGNGEFPSNPVSFSDIYGRMKNQSLKENAGDVVEVLSRTVANAAVLFVAYMTAGVVIEAGAAVIPVITVAQKYLEPFVASITQGGGAVLERAVSSGVSIPQAAAIVIGQAAPVVKCVAEVAKVSYFAAQEGPGGGGHSLEKVDLVEEVKKIEPNKIHHILQKKHNWNKVVKNPNDWQEVAMIVNKVMKEGINGTYKGVFRKVLEICGQTVEVIYVKPDGVDIVISNAWVK
jgi:hypothetical protein